MNLYTVSLNTMNVTTVLEEKMVLFIAWATAPLLVTRF